MMSSSFMFNCKQAENKNSSGKYQSFSFIRKYNACFEKGQSFFNCSSSSDF